MSSKFERDLARIINSKMKVVTSRIQSKMDVMDQSLISMYQGKSPDDVEMLIAERIESDLGVQLSPENLRAYTEAVVAGVPGKLVAVQQKL